MQAIFVILHDIDKDLNYSEISETSERGFNQQWIMTLKVKRITFLPPWDVWEIPDQ